MPRTPRLHPFRRFLAENRRSQQWACERAAALGKSLSQGHLSEVMSGSEKPSIDMLALLEEVSGRKVTSEEMIRWHLRCPSGV